MPLPSLSIERTPLWPDGHPAIAHVADAERPTLTAYPVATDRATGAVLICPGGGYGSCSPIESEPIARWVNSLGLTAFVLEYRVAPHRHPAPLHDIRRAIRRVRHEADRWQIRPDKLAALGFSAGGHLVATAGTQFDLGTPGADDPVERQSSRPDALVLCYPVISFVAHAHEGSVTNLLGEGASPELRRALSAELNVTAETPPTFLWHTAADEPVPVQNSLLFAESLAAHGVPFALHVFPTGRHGLNLARDEPLASAWTTLCAAWLDAQGISAG